LSGGAIAGIVIGGVVLLAIVGGVAFWMGKKRKSSAGVAPSAYEPYQGQHDQSQMQYAENNDGGWAVPMQNYKDVGQVKAELPTDHRRAELQ
jgi:hypothetical protein